MCAAVCAQQRAAHQRVASCATRWCGVRPRCDVRRLAESPTLRYGQLLAFERALLALEARHVWLSLPPPLLDTCGWCQRRQLIVFCRAGLLVVVNLHAHVAAHRVVLRLDGDTGTVALAPSPLPAQTVAAAPTADLAADEPPEPQAPPEAPEAPSKPHGSPHKLRVATVLRELFSSDATEFGGRGRPGRAVTDQPAAGAPHADDAGRLVFVDVPAHTACVFDCTLR